jgi:IS1 family transposase
MQELSILVGASILLRLIIDISQPIDNTKSSKYNKCMNQLSVTQRTRVVAALVEGNSIRSTCRMTGVAKGTVLKLLVDLGSVCAKYQHDNLRNLNCKLIQCDEIWSFCYAREKNIPEDKQGQFGYGDVWTFVAIDADTKLVITWFIGRRDTEDAEDFAWDIKRRMSNRIQLSTDGHHIYHEAIKRVFGYDVDYAQVVKHYGNSYDKYGQVIGYPKCIGAEPKRIRGNPDMEKVSTSYVERQNLTMRMAMRRYTRLTNGFSKKIDNLRYSLALHYMYYNFARVHKSLGSTPAMMAGVTDHAWTIEDIIGLLSN